MDGGSPEEAEARIEAALNRIEAATHAMARRHDALKADVAQSINELNVLLDRMDR